MDHISENVKEVLLDERSARIIINCIREVNEYLETERVNVTIVIRVLKKSRDKRITEFKLDKLKSYGALRGKYSRRDLRYCINHLIKTHHLTGSASGYVACSSENKLLYPTLVAVPQKKKSSAPKSFFIKKESSAKSQEVPKPQYKKSSANEYILCSTSDERFLRISAAKLDLPEDELKYMGYVSCGRSRLYWLFRQEEHYAHYYAIEFTEFSHECMKFTNIQHPRTYRTGVHWLPWKKGTCFFVNDPKCKYIQLTTNTHNLLFPVEPLPYLFYTETPFEKCSYLREDKTPI